MRYAPLIVPLCLTFGLSMESRGAEPLTLENVTSPAANTPDEPLAESFSLERATAYLDQSALDWTKNRKCFSCHTNYLYLLARPEVSANVTAHAQVREALEELVQRRWVESKPRWDAEVIMSAAILALNDQATSGKLHAATRRALDRIWDVQRADGGFDWLKCDWPPMESDDHFGATMALIAVGAAPQEYARSESAVAGVSKVLDYLRNNPPPTTHHEAMLLWADSYVDATLSDAAARDAIAKLRKLQLPSGGWALASMGDWRRADDTPQDIANADGYATGFVIYVLRRAGVPADDPGIQAGLRWLRENQRASGRWFTRSLHKDSRHFISHAGTAFAVLALSSGK